MQARLRRLALAALASLLPAVAAAEAPAPAPQEVAIGQPAAANAAAPAGEPGEAAAPAPAAEAVAPAAQDPASQPAAALEAAPSAEGAEDPAALASDAEDDEAPGEGEPEDAADAEKEEHAVSSESDIPGRRYTADLDDSALEKVWKEEPEKLGPISVGFTDAGRLINGVRFPEGENWIVVNRERSYSTNELIEYVSAAIDEVAAVYPGQRLRVGDVSRPEGGWFKPHISHQSGRDVDLSFYIVPPETVKGRKTSERLFDPVRNWALVRALITKGDVQFILVDKRLQKRLYDHALSIGEDREWLDSIFKNGRKSLVLHARRHRDHFHVRYYAGRAQELGRRVQPLMPKGKEENNVAIHRIRKGECLGSIAMKYDTTVSAIRKANGIKGNLIRPGRTLFIPLRRPCTECPVPPEVVVPARRLPPTTPEVFRRGDAVASPTTEVSPEGGGVASAGTDVAAPIP